MRLRNRINKATFWTDGALLRWPRDKRHFYQSLWACAEDSCCLEDDMFEVKLTAWASPLDSDMTIERFKAWRDELIKDGKLVPYTNGEPGKRYLYLPDMARHENPRNPQSPDLPLPAWVTYTVSGEGRDKRVRYTHGSRDAIVQSDPGNRNTTPALSCTELACTEQGEGPALPDLEAPEKPPGKVREGGYSLPECMQQSLRISAPEPYKGTCAGFVGEAITARYGLVGPSDMNLLAQAITDGCLEGCKGENAAACAVHLVGKMAKAAPTVRQSTLMLHCWRNDRYEVMK